MAKRKPERPAWWLSACSTVISPLPAWAKAGQIEATVWA